MGKDFEFLDPGEVTLKGFNDIRHAALIPGARFLVLPTLRGSRPAITRGISALKGDQAGPP